MPSRASDTQLSEAVFQYVETGAYPDDEQIISADLPTSALECLSEILEQARADVKISIRELSRLSAPDIDGWISQAKQLQGDIENSQRNAKEIVRLSKDGRNLREQADDAVGKLRLLRSEVSFNEDLEQTLGWIQELRQTLDTAQEALNQRSLTKAVAFLKVAETQSLGLRQFENTQLRTLIRERIEDVQNTMTQALTNLWDSLIHVDVPNLSVSIRQVVDCNGTTIDINTVVESFNNLGLLKEKILAFRKNFDRIILAPRFYPGKGNVVRALSVNSGDIRISGQISNITTERLFADLDLTIEYLGTCLPDSISNPLSEVLIPNLISQLISGTLSSSVPADLEGLHDFQATLQRVLRFSDVLKARGWKGQAELVAWAEDAPRVWLAKRSESSLHSMRQLLVRGLGNPRMVERVETQMVTQEDDLFAGDAKNDDWDAGWSDDDTHDTAHKPEASPALQENPALDSTEEVDVDAWGLGDDVAEGASESSHEKPAGVAQEDDDGTDAWGWGEGDDNHAIESPKASQISRHVQQTPRSNRHPSATAPTEREVILKETYNITALPEQILEIIIQAVEDADSLAKSAPTSNPVAPAAKRLFLLPGVLLTMYRATAPTFYASDRSGSMFLYNDSLYLAEQLRGFVEHYRSRTIDPMAVSMFNLEPDISALEVFGKRAYGKEMESQRTILGDLLDGAQGFANSTEHPFARECDLAVSSCVDRLREVNGQWQSVLSRSALLQATGSLLSTIINKLIVDIEDMADITESESHRLIAFCNSIAALEDLFLPEQPRENIPDVPPLLPQTAIYTPGWLKFQYLINILESSLADIKYLWTEGELSLEFEPGELIDLVEALFADSEQRRRAIGDIRKGHP